MNSTKTLSDSIKDWMVRFKKNSVKATTYDRLEVSLSLMKKYPIAYVRMVDLVAEDVQDYIDAMVKDGYGISTIKKQFHLVTGYLRHANATGEYQYAIYNLVRLPVKTQVKKQTRSVVAYNMMEQKALIKVFSEDVPLYKAAYLMMETGMRVGEVLALTWDDVLWDRKALKINKTLIRITNTHKCEVQNDAKSYSSNRIIPLSTQALKILNDLGEKADDPHWYIFADNNGKPFVYEAIRWHVRKACQQANVKYVGMHVFRHTFATNCYHRGCDVKILSKLLGHSDVTITYNVYIHLFGDALEEMRSIVE